MKARKAWCEPHGRPNLQAQRHEYGSDLRHRLNIWPKVLAWADEVSFESLFHRRQILDGPRQGRCVRGVS